MGAQRLFASLAIVLTIGTCAFGHECAPGDSTESCNAPASTKPRKANSFADVLSKMRSAVKKLSTVVGKAPVLSEEKNLTEIEAARLATPKADRERRALEDKLAQRLPRISAKVFALYKQFLPMKIGNVPLLLLRYKGPSSPEPIRVSACAVRTLNPMMPTPGHSVAAVRALKRSLWATAGGKGA